MSATPEIGLNILSIVKGFLMDMIYYFFSIVIPSRKLWRINKDSEITICLASTRTQTGQYIRLSTGIGQVVALSFISRSLYNAYKTKEPHIYLSDDSIGDELENDLILLGSPKTNSITARFFQELERDEPDTNDRVWQDNNGIIHLKDGGQETIFKGEICDNVIKHDFGLILVKKNIFSTHENRKLFLFSGSHTYGTAAAAKYFCKVHANKIKFPFFNVSKKDYIAIVSCDVVDGDVINIRLEFTK